MSIISSRLPEDTVKLFIIKEFITEDTDKVETIRDTKRAQRSKNLCALFARFCLRSAADHSFEAFGIPISLHFDLRSRGFDLIQIV